MKTANVNTVWPLDIVQVTVIKAVVQAGAVVGLLPLVLMPVNAAKNTMLSQSDVMLVNAAKDSVLLRSVVLLVIVAKVTVL